MRRWYTEVRVKLLVWYLARLVDKPTSYPQTIEQEMGALAQMYELPAVQRYLDKQEAYLKDMIAEDVVTGRMPESAYYARFMAGRLHEIRLFRDKLASAFAFHQRRKKERTLAQGK